MFCLILNNRFRLFLNRLKGSGILLGFDVYFSKTQNTKDEVAAGRFYLDCDIQEMPAVKRLQINFNYVDRFGDVLIETLAN